MRNKLHLLLAAFLVAYAGLLTAADLETGKKLYSAKGCVGCHGVAGASKLAIYPALKGKSSDFIKQQLLAFKTGARDNAIMRGMVAGLSAQDIDDLAGYLAAQ